MRCNLNCGYCTQKSITGHRPIAKEVSYLGWVRWFLRFPYKIKEVYVSGGEPTLHKDFAKIVNFLLDKGYYVYIFTNLADSGPLLDVKESNRLRIKATYHHGLPLRIFEYCYNLIKNIHTIRVDEIEYPQVLYYSSPKDMIYCGHNRQTGEVLYSKDFLRISPDLTINLNCFNLINE